MIKQLDSAARSRTSMREATVLICPVPTDFCPDATCLSTTPPTTSPSEVPTFGPANLPTCYADGLERLIGGLVRARRPAIFSAGRLGAAILALAEAGEGLPLGRCRQPRPVRLGRGGPGGL